MKKLIWLTSVLFTSVTIYSQRSNVYIKGGLNIANISTTNDGRIEDANSLASFHVGLLGDLSVNRFLAIQPALLFTGKGAKTQSGEPSDATYFKSTSNPYYIELPVNIVIKLPLAERGSNFLVGAGPYVAMGVGGKNKAEGKIFGVGFKSEDAINFSDDDPTTGNYEEGAGFGIIKRFDYGLNATVGLELGDALVSVNYGYGLAKLQSGSESSQDDKNKHRVLGLSLGFRL